jgi:hypothetical protein
MRDEDSISYHSLLTETMTDLDHPEKMTEPRGQGIRDGNSIGPIATSLETAI